MRSLRNGQVCGASFLPPGSPRYGPKQNFRLPLELEILTNRRCALCWQTEVFRLKRFARTPIVSLSAPCSPNAGHRAISMKQAVRFLFQKDAAGIGKCSFE